MLGFQLSSYTHIKEIRTLHFIRKWDTKIKENYLSDIRTNRSNPSGIVRYLTKSASFWMDAHRTINHNPASWHRTEMIAYTVLLSI